MQNGSIRSVKTKILDKLVGRRLCSADLTGVWNRWAEKENIFNFGITPSAPENTTEKLVRVISQKQPDDLGACDAMGVKLSRLPADKNVCIVVFLIIIIRRHEHSRRAAVGISFCKQYSFGVFTSIAHYVFVSIFTHTHTHTRRGEAVRLTARFAHSVNAVRVISFRIEHLVRVMQSNNHRAP